ncbi:hypothetical protein [Hyphomicrobium sp. ghe19]|uniref:hypothetical protein n=1 Tax=Hyphomicrobium sp. ghe19 TaxID=2682968 RepID=UPI001366F3CA|nr:hypothetical protein HYPP_02619 [Hyphomicrobium sp. ghe19]
MDQVKYCTFCGMKDSQCEGAVVEIEGCIKAGVYGMTRTQAMRNLHSAPKCVHGYVSECDQCGNPPQVSHCGLDATLEARGNRYGEFRDNAAVAQALKRVFRRSVKWDDLEDHQKEALDIIASKISRLLSGDPNYPDNWHDIQGFAKLVEERLSK